MKLQFVISARVTTIQKDAHKNFAVIIAIILDIAIRVVSMDHS